MNNIKELELQEIKEFLKSNNEPEFRAKQIFHWLWKKNVASFDEMNNLPKTLLEKLKTEFSLNQLKITYNVQSKTDKSSKYIFETFDDLLIEGVLIPDKERVTVCISTQVGCPLGCTFCATGTMGLKRNLTAAEIYEQVYLLNLEALKIYSHNITNIVIMGMGEPLLNLENTQKAIEFITSESGLAMSPSRITLSTVGVVKQLYKLADSLPKYNLAVSLHSAINEKRSKIMSVNLHNPIPELIKALKYYHEKTGARISFEYLMIDKFNDSLDDAKALAEFCRNFPTKINLIEYNSVSNSKFRKSSQENLNAFFEFLESKNMVVTVRRSKGQDIEAACGQLVKKLV